MLLSSVFSSFLPFPVPSSFLLPFVSPIYFCRFSFKLLVFVVLLRMVLFFDYQDLLFLCISVQFFSPVFQGLICFCLLVHWLLPQVRLPQKHQSGPVRWWNQVTGNLTRRSVILFSGAAISFLVLLCGLCQRSLRDCPVFIARKNTLRTDKI